MFFLRKLTVEFIIWIVYSFFVLLLLTYKKAYTTVIKNANTNSVDDLVDQFQSELNGLSYETKPKKKN